MTATAAAPPRLLGIDVGGTSARAAVRVGSEVCWSRSVPTGRDLGVADGIDLLDELVRGAEDGVGVDAVGVGFPGLVDHAAGTVRSSVILPRWSCVELAATLHARTGRRVRVDNDVNVAALAEHHAEGGDAATDMLFVAIGTGIGGALVLDGQLRRGPSGLAGEVGHMRSADGADRCTCGAVGCIGSVSSGTALGARLGLGPAELREAVLGGAHLSEVRAAGRSLGVVVAGVVNLLELSLVVLGGGLGNVAPFADAVAAAVSASAMDENARRCRVRRSVLGEDAGVIGAAMLATSAVDPSEH